MTLGLLPHFDNTAALRYFYEVARYGSFRLAAEKIYIAASAISRQIQMLEQELGVQLFERDRKGLRLTSAGETLLYRTRRAMNELATARAEIEELRGAQRGLVKLGVNETVAREFVLDFLGGFRGRFPHISFDITVANTHELAQALLGGELDVIVGYGGPQKNGLEEVAAFALQTCITLRTDHPLAGRDHVSVADLVDETFIMPPANSLLRQTLNAIFARSAVHPAAMVTTNSFELMAGMVVAGFGVAAQIRLSAGPDPVRPQIVYVPVRDPEIRPAALGCYVRTGGAPSMAVSIGTRELQGALATWTQQLAGPAQLDPVAPDAAPEPAML